MESKKKAKQVPAFNPEAFGCVALRLRIRAVTSVHMIYLL